MKSLRPARVVLSAAPRSSTFAGHVRLLPTSRTTLRLYTRPLAPPRTRLLRANPTAVPTCPYSTMADLNAPIPSLKLNDGNSIPMVCRRPLGSSFIPGADYNYAQSLRSPACCRLPSASAAPQPLAIAASAPNTSICASTIHAYFEYQLTARGAIAWLRDRNCLVQNRRRVADRPEPG